MLITQEMEWDETHALAMSEFITLVVGTEVATITLTYTVRDDLRGITFVTYLPSNRIEAVQKLCDGPAARDCWWQRELRHKKG